MKIGASSFAASFQELIREVDSIELYLPKLGVYENTKLNKSGINKIKDFLSSYNIQTSIHAPYYSYFTNYPKELVVDTANLNKTSKSLLIESIDIANDLDSDVVVIHPGRVGNNREKSFNNMVKALSELSKIAEDKNVLLGLENKEGTDIGNLCVSYYELKKAIETVNSQNLKITFDIGHANLTCKGDPIKLREFVKSIKGYVVHIHIHDNNGKYTDEYNGDMHKPPGYGNIDFSVLKELNFNGTYNLEVFSIDDVKIGKRFLAKLLF